MIRPCLAPADEFHTRGLTDAPESIHEPSSDVGATPTARSLDYKPVP
jgi:hypothetical protein